MMNRNVDERVVSMKFDNAKFERGIAKSQKSVEDFNKSLKFEGASKGIEQIQMKISALDVAKFELISRAMDGLINKAEILVKSLSFDQVFEGFEKYNAEVNDVLTVKNSANIATEEALSYLDELRWYSDETSYAYDQMARAYSQMLNQGGKIEELVPLIEGMANATAFAGKGAAEFQSVIYNLTQSYGQGYLEARDWRSVQNMGVSSKALVEELIKAGEELNLINKNSVTISNFRDSLQYRWATQEVLNLAFGRFASYTTEIKKALDSGEFETTAEAMEALKEQFKDLNPEYAELAIKAWEAAQQSKTFSDAIDATKDAASSAWAEIFRYVMGNTDEAITLWTNVRKGLESAFVDPLKSIRDRVKEVMDFNPVVDAANQWTEVEDGVEKTVYATAEQVDAYRKEISAIKGLIDSLDNASESEKKYIKIKELSADGQTVIEKKVRVTSENIGMLSEEQLKAIGVSDEMAESLKKMSDEALNAGYAYGSLKEFINDASETTRTKFLNTLSNIARIFGGLADAARAAISELVNGPDGNKMFSIFSKTEAWTEKLKKALSPDKDGNYGKIFIIVKDAIKGLLMVLKVAYTLIGGPFRIALYVVKNVMKAMGIGIKEVTQWVGKVTNKFGAWISSLIDLKKIAAFMTPLMSAIAGSIRQLISVLKEFYNDNKEFFEIGIQYITDFIKGLLKLAATLLNGPIRIAIGVIEKVINAVKDGTKNLNIDLKGLVSLVGNAANKFINWVNSLIDFKKIAAYVSPLIEGIVEAIKNLFEILTDFYDDHKEFFDLGLNYVKGFIQGILKGIPSAIKTVVDFFGSILKSGRKKLGIHSPSKETFEDGKNFILGFVKGFLEYAGKLLKIVVAFFKNLIVNIADIFSSIDVKKLREKFSNGIIGNLISVITNAIGLLASVLGKLKELVDKTSVSGNSLLALGIIALIFIAFMSLASAAKAVTKTFNSIGTAIGNIADLTKTMNKELKKTAKAARFKMYAESIKALAASFALVAASLYLLSQVDFGDIWTKALLVVGVIAALALMVLGISKLSSDSKTTWQGAVVIVELIGIILSLALLMRVLSKIDFNSAYPNVLATIAILLIFQALIKSISKIAKNGGTSVLQAAAVLAAVALIFYSLGKTLKTIAGLDPKDAALGFTIILGFSAIIAGLMIIQHFFNRMGNTDMSKTFLGIAAMFMALAITLRIVSKIDDKDVGKGLFIILAFSGIVAGLIAIQSFFNKGKIGNASAFLGIAALFLAMSLSLAIIAALGDKADKAFGVILMFSAIIELFVVTVGLFSGNSVKMAGTLLAMATLFIAMAASLALISLVESPERALGVIIGLAAVLGVLMILTSVMKNSTSTIAVLTGSLATLALILLVLSGIDASDALRALSMVTVLGVILAGLMYVTSKVNNKTVAALAVMTVMMVSIAGILYLLGGTAKADNYVKTALSLAVLMSAMAGVIAILSLIGVSAVGALVGVFVMSALAIPMYIFMSVLSKMSSVDNALSNAIALATLMSVMALIIPILALCGALWIPALIGIGLLSAMAIPMYLFILILTKMDEVKNADKNVTLIIKLLGTVTACLVAIALVAPLLLVAAAALVLMALVFDNMALVLLALVGLQKLGLTNEDIKAAGEMLETMATYLGSALGKFIAAFVEAILEVIPKIATALSDFMTNLQPFVDGVNKLDTGFLEKIGILTAAIELLLGSRFATLIIDVIGGLGAMAEARQLADFWENIEPFIDGIGGVDNDLATKTKAVADAMKAMSDAGLGSLFMSMMDGITVDPDGTQKITSFGLLASSLTDLVDPIKKFSEQLGEGINTDALSSVGTLISAITDMASAMPSSGFSFKKLIVGSGDLSDFSSQMKSFGDGIKGLNDAIKPVLELDIDSKGGLKLDKAETNFKNMSKAIGIGTELATLANKLPNTEGAWGWMSGKADLGEFGSTLTAFAQGLVAFALIVSGKSSFTVGEETYSEGVPNVSYETAFDVANQLADLADKLPNTEGAWGWASGKANLSEFGSTLGEFAKGLVTFAAYTSGKAGFYIGRTYYKGGVGSDKLTNAFDMADRLITLANKLPNTEGFWGWASGQEDIGEFGEKLGTFAKGLVAFAAEGKNLDVDSADNMGDVMDDLYGVMTVLQNLDPDVIITFSDNLTKLAKNGLKNFTDQFSKSENINSAVTGLKTFIGDLNSKDSLVGKASKAVIEGGRALGKYFVAGLVQGIQSEADDAQICSAKLALIIMKAYAEVQDINSPSKVGYRYGGYWVSGIVNGMKNMYSTAQVTSRDLAIGIQDSFSEALETAYSIIGDDMDVEPTIRPVIDMSNVNSGINSINRMVGTIDNPMLFANASNLNYKINMRSNTGADEVVSAIDGLKSTIGDSAGNSYTINGITYDDGSNVSNAIEALIDAVKMERRI